MTPIAPHITAFLRERLPIERRVSDHTISSYSFAFQLLFAFASERLKVGPSALQLEHIDAPLVLDWLQHLETKRGNSPASRNTRLAAIKSFMRFVQYRVPSALEQVQRILAIPAKKTDKRLIDHLSVSEVQAILDVPNPTRRDGIRDRAMLCLGFTAGLRVSELVGLRVDDLTLEPTPSIFVRGKGRRQRALPLTKECAKALRAWLAVRGDAPVPELFLNRRGVEMTRSGFEYILHQHVQVAARRCPSLLQKRVSPHVLRHTCAVIILQATKDIRKVSLWLGHASIQTTEMYTRADPSELLETVNAVTPPVLRRGRFRPPDRLLAFLKQQSLCGDPSEKGGPLPCA
jgi:site-specific recombinase XerD